MSPPFRRMRRRLLQAALLAPFAVRVPRAAAAPAPLLRAIPKGGERIPAIGLGTWIVFDVGDDAPALAQREQVLREFFALGGRLIDSSPMYGSAEAVIGELLRRIRPSTLFAATKVWTPGKRLGERQMQRSQELWGVAQFDLMQIHNMLDWERHVDTLQALKADGKLRYIGITTSHGRRHQALEKALTRVPFDFVQFTYNIADREAEQRLLPLAGERGIAVIANRPFQGGELFERVRGKPLPPIAGELGCKAWSQFFLKFILGDARVACAIPATSKPAHLRENMAALAGLVPDRAARAAMVQALTVV